MFQYLNKLFVSRSVLKTTKIVTLCLSCIIIMFACRKDKELTTGSLIAPEKAQTITIAKAFFNAYMDFIPKNFKFKSIQPFYEGAVAEGNVVEIPFALDGKIAGISQYDNFECLGKQRLIILNTPNVGLGKACYIINYAPSKAFKGKIAEVTTRNFQKLQFDGVVSISDLDGKNVSAYVIEAGTIANNLILRQSDISRRGKLDFCDISLQTVYCQGSMGDYTTPLYPCGSTLVVDCYMFGTGQGSGWPWGDGNANNSENWASGTSGGSNSNTGNSVEPVVVVQMCPRSIIQGFLDAGANYIPSIGGANMGNLAGRSVVSAGGHYKDLVVPTTTVGNIYIPRFGIDIYEINTEPLNFNATIDNIDHLGREIANAYGVALRNWNLGRRLYTEPPSFSQGLDFLNEWKTAFNHSHPNNHMEIMFNGNPGVQVRDTMLGCIP